MTDNPDPSDLEADPDGKPPGDVVAAPEEEKSLDVVSKTESRVAKSREIQGASSQWDESSVFPSLPTSFLCSLGLYGTSSQSENR